MSNMGKLELYLAIMAKNTLDTNEAAVYLGITPEGLRNQLSGIPHYKGHNGRNYFRKEELDNYRCAYECKVQEQDIATREAIRRMVNEL